MIKYLLNIIAENKKYINYKINKGEYGMFISQYGIVYKQIWHVYKSMAALYSLL